MGLGKHILVAEDDEQEKILYQHALQKVGIGSYTIVPDGLEVIDYLQGAGKYHARTTYPRPSWLLLDFKMPRKTGLEVLAWLNENPQYRIVPTIMLSNSNHDRDILGAYALGVNAFFTKPTRLQELVDTLALINHFWTVAQRPPPGALLDENLHLQEQLV